MRSLCLGIAILLIVQVRADAQPVQRDTDLMTINGAKNPELIPQWSAWGLALRIISSGSRELPSMVYHVASAEERAMITREADAVQRIDAACQTKMAEVTKRIGKEKTADLDAEGRRITLDCRWQTLYARNRILERINPDARAALVAFVESTKKGTQVSLPKKSLARYLEPE